MTAKRHLRPVPRLCAEPAVVRAAALPTGHARQAHARAVGLDLHIALSEGVAVAAQELCSAATLPRPFVFAGATHTSAGRRDVGVLRRERVSSIAPNLAGVVGRRGRAPAVVLGTKNDVQMIRADATSVLADVVGLVPNRNRASEQFVDGAMSRGCLSLNRRPAVAPNDGASPVPTRRRLLDEVHETTFKWPSDHADAHERGYHG